MAADKPDSVKLRKDGDGAYIVFVGTQPGVFPPAHVAVYADIEGGVTLDGVLDLGRFGLPLSVEQATSLHIALGAAIAEAVVDGR